MSNVHSIKSFEIFTARFFSLFNNFWLYLVFRSDAFCSTLSALYGKILVVMGWVLLTRFNPLAVDLMTTFSFTASLFQWLKWYPLIFHLHFTKWVSRYFFPFSPFYCIVSNGRKSWSQSSMIVVSLKLTRHSIDSHIFPTTQLIREYFLLFILQILQILLDICLGI